MSTQVNRHANQSVGRQAGKPLTLGIDAGGTQTRWALADEQGQIVAEGAVAGLSANQMNSQGGSSAVMTAFRALARAVVVHGKPVAIRAGLTGFGGQGAAPLKRALAALFTLPESAITLSNDIEIAYLDSFKPGEGYLIYAGTGSIGAYIDQEGEFHRAGGRGVLLDDGGGGYWIAREAMRHIWRNEDEQPGRWRASPMANAVFAQIGGDDWALSRQFLYAQERGQIGVLALAVAASADTDPVAADILTRAGQELARLAMALTGRYGPRPVALSGRAATLHPSIFASMRAALPDAVRLMQGAGHAHHAAARFAGKVATI